MSGEMGTLGDAERCNRCGGENVTWSAPSPLWNLVMRGNDTNGKALWDDLVCIRCFVVLAEGAGVRARWRVSANPEPEGLVKVTPSGRVWDAEKWLWVEPQRPPVPTSTIRLHWFGDENDDECQECGWWAHLDSARRHHVEDALAADIADHEAQIRDLLEEREELLTEIRRLRMGNHPAGRALPLSLNRQPVNDNVLALAEALTERDAEHEGGLCGSDGGRGIGAGHVCLCIREAGHPLDDDRPHGCGCFARWACPDCPDADPVEGCAACGASPAPLAGGVA